MKDKTISRIPNATTFFDVLRQHAKQSVDVDGYIFLQDGETDEIRLTYAELDRQARGIAAWLQDIGARGERVLLLHPPGLEYIAAFFGCLYAGAIAVPVYPPRLNHSLGRFQAILADVQAKAALSTNFVLDKVKLFFDHIPELKALHWLAVDDLPAGAELSWQEITPAGDDIAFIQYTSGSTSTPKGVILTHRNLLHNSALIHDSFGHTADSKVVTWLPPYHDMGLIGGILQPMYAGFPAIVMSPVDFLQRPLRWLQAISHYQATSSGGPNFAYDLCVRKIKPEERETLDLSSWTVAFNGAEPIRPETLDRFVDAFSPYGFRRQAFYPCYGLAEATLIVSGGTPTTLPITQNFQTAALAQRQSVPEVGDGGQILVGCGQDLQKVTIVNPDTMTSCAPDQIGEIWIASPSVAQGYWRRPEETAKTFAAHLADTGEGPFLRTGDLGFIHNQELFITGRIKDLIIIRGRNHYPQDIELTVEQSHDALRQGCVAAFSVEVENEERLIVVQEVKREQRRKVDVADVTAVIRQAIATQHDLQVYAIVLLRPSSIPKTSSGKIQRHAARAAFLEGSLRVIGEWQAELSTPIESDDAASIAEPSIPNATIISNWLTTQISEMSHIPPAQIDPRRPFTYYGLSSLQAVELSGELGSWLDRRLSPTLLYDFPTIASLARYLATDENQLAPIPTMERSVSTTEPIAIVGIGCRFPGAANPAAFWELLCNGEDAITTLPPERRALLRAFYEHHVTLPGDVDTHWGGFLDNIDQFDPHFFGISPREASQIDPQQRLLLEVAWEAAEDAGQTLDRLHDSNTGVFVGISSNDYGQLRLTDATVRDPYTSTGNAFSIAANRLSYLFNLHGPSLAVDTACSSSLSAVHLACQSLRRQECTLALAGGVSLILSPILHENLAQAGFLAPDGRCKTFDARADGYVRSEGCGMVVLKPLSLAQADGDQIYAVIRGGALNNDGHTNGLTAPNGQAQEAVLRTAYQQAGVSPSQLQYVETHGTGTALGDPIEVQALGRVLSTDRIDGDYCLLGSVKSNIGHLEAAAGIAGLIKTALSIKYGQIPPSIHFTEANPHIPFADLPVCVQQALGPWPKDEQKLAGVSSFGFGGTNVHLVLASPPPAVKLVREPSAALPHLLPLSAHSPEALRDLAAAYASWLKSDDATTPIWTDICYSTGVRRSHHDHRLAVVAQDKETAVSTLAAFLQDTPHPQLFSGSVVPRQQKLVFVFSGQGSQWLGMGRQLMTHEPIFRQTLVRCQEAMQPFITWSIEAALTADASHSRLDEVDVIQPLIFAVQVAVATLWQSWGIQPDAVVGQSMGEIAAAVVAGALSLADGARVICRRSQIAKTASGNGGMAVVELSLAEAQEAIIGYENRVSVAVSNSSRSTVLAGDQEALATILDTLQNQDTFCRWVKVDYASHSPQMEALRPALLEALAAVQPQPARIPFYSTVTGTVLEEPVNADYWVRNLREPVLFVDTLQTLLADDHHIFVEISPHPILLPAIQQELNYQEQDAVVLPSLRREKDEHEILLTSFAQLYTIGYPVDWQTRYPTDGRYVPLPIYPWQRERFWINSWEKENGRFAHTHSQTGHPLIHQLLRAATHEGSYFLETTLSPQSVTYLADHRIQGTAILPASAYIETALAVAQILLGDGAYVIQDFDFKKVLAFPNDQAQTIQVAVSSTMSKAVSLQFFSKPADSQQEWTLHATGSVHMDAAAIDTGENEIGIPAQIQQRCSETVDPHTFYQTLSQYGLEYGRRFQRISQLWRQSGEALARVHLDETSQQESHAYHIHPILLDACFQVLGAGTDMLSADTYLPVGLRDLRLYQRPETASWVYGRIESQTGENLVTGDVFLLDNAGRMIVAATGLRLQRFTSEMQSPADWFYKMQWQLQENYGIDSETEASSSPVNWLIFADNQGIGQALQRRLADHRHTSILVSASDAFQVIDEKQYQLAPDCPADFTRLLQETADVHIGGIIYLWGVDVPAPDSTNPDSFHTGQALGSSGVLHLVQALAQQELDSPPRLWLVTSGVQTVNTTETTAGSLLQSPLWGLARTLNYEHPEMRCTLVDLSHTNPETEMLLQELWQDDQERQVVLRNEKRFVARLTQFTAVDPAQSYAQQLPLVAANGHPYRLEANTPGILDGLTLRATERRAPDAGEVEIEIQATGLNFSDVLKATGIYPGLNGGVVPLGAECAGQIVALGEGVTDFQIGDKVIAIAPFSFGKYATTSQYLVASKPANLTMTQAAAIPIAFLTAYYALSHLGQLHEGERVLIHAASGGVGLAAVQLAQRAKAEIFATAGNKEKRAFLRSLGVPHVMDSRSLDFAAEIMSQTDGKGVDVVLNSLAGAGLQKSLAVLGAYGRFLEIGKRDIYQNSKLDLFPFRNNLSFFAIDLDHLIRARPAFISTLLRELVQQFVAGDLRPLPVETVPVTAIADAFHQMAQAQHIGKIVVTNTDQDIQIAPANGHLFHADGTHLITGGLGGLGLTVAKWLVQQGVKHLALLSRGELADKHAAVQEQVNALEMAGVQVRVLQGDIADYTRVAAVMADIEQTMPPLRGIVHAAGILDDGVLLQLDQNRLSTVMQPKVQGAWHLHTLTSTKSLDYFVLFSSVASLLGSPGQGNYAAANTFLDALAHYRRAQGQPALSINWGPWAEVGLAATTQRARLAQQGFGSISPQQGTEVLAHLLTQNGSLNAAGVAVMPFDMNQWYASNPTVARSPLFSALMQNEPNKPQPRTTEIQEALRATKSGNTRRLLLENYLREQLAHVLRISPARIDAEKPLSNYGLDSLIGLELRNRLDAGLGLELPATIVWNYPTITALVPYIAAQLHVSLSSDKNTKEIPLAEKNRASLLKTEVAELSDAEAEAMLLAELSDLEYEVE